MSVLFALYNLFARPSASVHWQVQVLPILVIEPPEPSSSNDSHHCASKLQLSDYGRVKLIERFGTLPLFGAVSLLHSHAHRCPCIPTPRILTRRISRLLHDIWESQLWRSLRGSWLLCGAIAQWITAYRVGKKYESGFITQCKLQIGLFIEHGWMATHGFFATMDAPCSSKITKIQIFGLLTSISQKMRSRTRVTVTCCPKCNYADRICASMHCAPGISSPHRTQTCDLSIRNAQLCHVWILE